jgi:hypothetical protein
MVVVLRTDTRAIELVSNANDWCQMVLVTASGDRIELGADMLRIIVGKLLDALDQRPATAAGLMQGRPVTNVLSLSEKHASLFRSFTPGENMSLWVQDANGALLDRIELTPLEQSEWIAILQEAVS